jgi:hypothetical protein
MFIVLDEFLLRNLESDDRVAGTGAAPTFEFIPGAAAAGAAPTFEFIPGAAAGAATIFEFIREFVGAAGAVVVLELLVPKIFPRKSMISTFRLYFFYL